MKRHALLLWIAVQVVVVSCAQGSDLGGLGAGVLGSGGAVTSLTTGGVTSSSTTSSTSSTTTSSTSSTTTSSTSSTSTSSTSSSGGTGFGPCVTQQDVNNQSTGFLQVGFCVGNPLACILCSNDGVNAGDTVCSPTCICTTMPPICGSDAGTD